MKIGIDHIAVYIPNQYLALEDLARARNVDPNKFLVGLGVREMTVPLPEEDVVVLAANAGYRVLKESNVSPSEIGLLIVGTESAEDRAKPTATHVHELLGIRNSCRLYDIVHACAGATYGVLSAIDWLCHPNHSYALVIASDIAKYGKGSPGEPTQGAGAVAMLLGKNPRLLTLQEVNSYGKNVYDFWRPWGKEYPMIDGVYSTQCYLNAVEKCFGGQDMIINKKSAFLYHTPYPKLIRYAHAKVVSMIDGDLNWERHFEEYAAITDTYLSKVGNIYTGSLWLSLASFFEHCYLSGKKNLDELMRAYEGCYLFSYGSGCGAILMKGEFSPTWAEMSQHFQIQQGLAKRVKLSVEEYEKLFDGENIPSCSSTNGWFKFEGVRESQRNYAKRCSDIQ